MGPAGSELGPGHRGPGEEPKQADMQTGRALVPSLILELDLWGSVGPQAPEDLPFQTGYSLFLSRDLGEEVLLGSLPSFPRDSWSFVEAPMELFRRTDPTSGQPAQFPRDTTRGEEKCVECCQDFLALVLRGQGAQEESPNSEGSLHRAPPPHPLPAPPVRRPCLQEPRGLGSMP